MTIVHSHVEQKHLGRGRFALSLHGEFDLYTASDLRAALERVRRGGAHTIFVDLAGATFVDVTTLRVLADARKELAGHGGSMVLTNVRAPLRRVLEQTRLDEYFDEVYGREAPGVANGAAVPHAA